jgi:hypothetical protein
MPCPRCGYPAAPGATFCPHCGRYLATLQWVAEPPPSTVRPRRIPVPFRYTGPPRYRDRPRGGFAPGPWRPALEGPGQVPAPERQARSLAAVVVPLLWALAVVAVLAAGAEVWRYVLLLASRERALSADAVAASDALVFASGVGALLLGLVAGGFLVAWTLRASAAASARSGSRPSRAPRDVVLGWVVPGLNLAVPGAVLSEIEHGALDRPPRQRPVPSRLLRVWWGLWAAGVLLSVVALAWSLRTGVQARADGVVLHAVLDLLAAATAGATAVVVGRLTALLGPVRAPKRQVLLAVRDAPSSPAAPATPA